MEVEGKEGEKFKLISYARYESELRERIIEGDKIRDELPEYMWVLN